MADNRKDVVTNVVARDKTSAGAKSAAQNFERLTRKADRLQSRLDRANAAVDRYRRAASRAASPTNRLAKAMQKIQGNVQRVNAFFGQSAVTLLGLGAAATSAFGPLVRAGQALAKAGKAAAEWGRGVAPVAAVLPALAAGAGLLFGSIALAAPGAARAVDPLVRAFVGVEQNIDGTARQVGGLQEKLGELASRDLPAVTSEFLRVNFPAVAGGMERITVASNAAGVAVARWVNSAEGQRAVARIVDETAAAAERLAPLMARAAIAVADMAGRAAGPGWQTATDLVGRFLDKVTALAESTSTGDVRAAIDDLAGLGGLVAAKFQALRDVGRWMGENTGAVKGFSDALGVAAIGIGYVTGNPIAVLGGALALLVNHWDQVSAAVSRVYGWFERVFSRPEFVMTWDAIRAAAGRLWAELQKVATEVAPYVMSFLESLETAWSQIQPSVQQAIPIVELFGKAYLRYIGESIKVTLAFASAALQAFTKVVEIVQKVTLKVGEVVEKLLRMSSHVPGIGDEYARAADRVAEANARMRAGINATERSIANLGQTASKVMVSDAQQYANYGGDSAAMARYRAAGYTIGNNSSGGKKKSTTTTSSREAYDRYGDITTTGLVSDAQRRAREAAERKREAAQRKRDAAARKREAAAEKARAAAERARQKALDAAAKANQAAMDRVNRLLDAAKQRADKLRAAYDQVFSTVKDALTGGSIVERGTSSRDIITSLRQQVAAVEKYEKTLRKLKARGLSGALLEDLAGKGVEGQAAADALLGGGKAAINTVNRLQGRLDKAGGRTAEFVAKSLYGERLEAAEARVKKITADALVFTRSGERIANKREAVFASGPSWAADDEGVRSTAAPVEVKTGDTHIRTTVELDGRVIRSTSRTVVNGALREQRWRTRSGKRW